MATPAATPTKPVIAVEIDDITLNFELDDSDINRFLNDQSPTDKIKPAYNMLIRGITETDKPTFKQLALASDGRTPRGLVVMQLSQLIAAEFGGSIDIKIKKPNASLPV